MARKPLSTIDWMQKSVDEIFAEPLKQIEMSDSPNINVHEKIEQFEQKAQINFNKTRAAPPPPGTKILLPKIGNYKPKILLSKDSNKAAASRSPYDDVHISDEKITENRLFDEHLQSNKVTSEQTRSFSEPSSECNIEADESGIYTAIDIKPDYDTSIIEHKERKVMIIGDKDIPLVLEGSYFEGDENNDNKSVKKQTGNNANIASKYELEEKDYFPEINAVVNVGEIVMNPLFEKQEDSEEKTDHDTPRHPYKKRRAPVPPSSYVSRHRLHSQTSHESDEEYPYIPEPDYEEEEATINFDGVSKKEQYQAQRRDQKIIKEYEGEDFSKYLDDDEGFQDHTFTWRKNIRHQRKPTTQKQQTIPKSKYMDGPAMSAPKLKPMKKLKHPETQHGSMKRQTLRDISYADCKMGVDDRTVRSVKSTSAGGRYVKRGKERTMIVDGDTGGGGYEEFLKMRHKGEGSLESNSSGDSGHETGDDLFQQEQYFYQMQPKQLREKQGKGSLWEKLTWRFKRHVGGYRMS